MGLNNITFSDSPIKPGSNLDDSIDSIDSIPSPAPAPSPSPAPSQSHSPAYSPASETVDCLVGPWSKGTCDSKGSFFQERSVLTPALNGGWACPLLTQSSNCLVDCSVGPWSMGSCDSNGSQKQTRSVISPAINGGSSCPILTQLSNCSVDCRVGAWSTNSNCDSNGIMIFTRNIITPARFGGLTCPTLTLSSNCPVDCKVGPWSNAPCNSSGMMTLMRPVLAPPLYGGAACPSLSMSSNCSVNCSVSPWSEFGACSASCGGGIQTQTRAVLAPAIFGGSACPTLTNTQTCGTNPCPVDCSLGPWSTWSQCTNGLMTQTRPITTQAAFGGSQCPPPSTLARSSNCPVDCVLSDWTSWSACSSSGGLTRTRTVKAPPANGGQCSAELSQSSNCPVPCAGSWSTWSPCTKICGGGTSQQTYTINRPASFGGTACPATNNQVNTQTCNSQSCHVGPKAIADTVVQPMMSTVAMTTLDVSQYFEFGRGVNAAYAYSTQDMMNIGWSGSKLYVYPRRRGISYDVVVTLTTFLEGALDPLSSKVTIKMSEGPAAVWDITGWWKMDDNNRIWFSSTADGMNGRIVVWVSGSFWDDSYSNAEMTLIGLHKWVYGFSGPLSTPISPKSYTTGSTFRWFDGVYTKQSPIPMLTMIGTWQSASGQLIFSYDSEGFSTVKGPGYNMTPVYWFEGGSFYVVTPQGIRHIEANVDTYQRSKNLKDIPLTIGSTVNGDLGVLTRMS